MNLNELIEKLSKNIEITVGFPVGKQVIYPPDDRKGHSNPGGQTVAQVASWNEFGTKRTPSRPFLKEAYKKNRNKISEYVKNYFKINNLRDEKYFDKIGLLMVDMVQDSIRNGNWIPNSERTKLQKLKWPTRQKLKNNPTKYAKEIQAELAQIKPLIDRGIMLKSVNYEVRKS